MEHLPTQYIKGSIHQEHITALNMYTSDNKASKIHESEADTTEKKNSQIQNRGHRFQLSQ